MTVIRRLTGATPSERLLAELCERTFHNLWTYPRVFRDQGKGWRGGEGKEVCDLLVVFGDDVIIFSDKSCQYPRSGDEARDWRRWRKRSIESSIEQLDGAERWIRDHPDRLFLDAACEVRFPINLTNSSRLRFHRVAVVTGATSRCRMKLGGSGSLLVHMVERRFWAQYGDAFDRLDLFTAREVFDEKAPVHIFDEESLPILMAELDTAFDFIRYLNDRAALARRARSVVAVDEADLLGTYLFNRSVAALPCFGESPEGQVLISSGGAWERLLKARTHRAWKAAATLSLEWDRRIARMGEYVMRDEVVGYWDPLVSAPPADFGAHEERVRQLARLGRLDRIQMSLSLQALRDEASEHFRTHIHVPLSVPDTVYAIVVAPDWSAEDAVSYRKDRQAFGWCFVQAAKDRFPEYRRVVCLLVEPTRSRFGPSVDLFSIDFREWTPAQAAVSARIRRDFEACTIWARSTKEYDLNEVVGAWNGVGRNELCPCGSRRKFKRCHGAPVGPL